jgi:hypothetical protein
MEVSELSNSIHHISVNHQAGNLSSAPSSFARIDADQHAMLSCQILLWLTLGCLLRDQAGPHRWCIPNR